jgi:hypothetical protein
MLGSLDCVTAGCVRVVEQLNGFEERGTEM